MRLFSSPVPRFISLFVLLFTTVASVHAKVSKGSNSLADGSPRIRQNLNKDWQFRLQGSTEDSRAGIKGADWQAISIPHTWNAEDTMDDAVGYRTGIGWYRKDLFLPPGSRGKKLFLYFEAVNQVAEVFVNDHLAGKHIGGYSGFVFDITELVDFNARRQVVAVKVDNTPDADIPPSSTADFNMYGGIYRDVWLIVTEKTHFSLSDFGSSGVYLETPDVSEMAASVKIRGLVSSDAKDGTVTVMSSIVNAQGRRVSSIRTTLRLSRIGDNEFEQTMTVQRPSLWSPESPHLYKLKTELYKEGRLVDAVFNPIGFRWFNFDPARGFFLNGQPYKLRGTNRHQDYLGIGNALSNGQHVKDLEIIKDMGFNAILLAHYQHDPSVLEAADRLGLIVWEEIPLVRRIGMSEEHSRNAVRMLNELIRQHYNHPSIFMWCYMNEIFLRPLNEPGFVGKTVELATKLEEIARASDPSRYTVVSANRPYDGSDVYNASGLMAIPKIVAWHMYFGWYYGNFKDFGSFLDAQHRRFPGRNIFVSEYGADYDTRLRAVNPAIGDGTADWARAYHESYLEQIEERRYLAGSAVWAQFDFGSESRGDSRPHVNTKGIFTSDRKPKDIAFLYKSYFSKAPTLHIASRDWSTRIGPRDPAAARDAATSGTAQGASVGTEPVTVYSNLSQVELLVNRRSLGVRPNGSSRKQVWDVPLKEGINHLEARGWHKGRQVSDRTQMRFIMRPQPLSHEFLRNHGLNVNVGDHAEFLDSKGRIWLADQPYEHGGWGYTGGDRRRVPLNVLATDDDPLFQTSREGISAYQFDVPDGDYEVELRFAEMSDTGRGRRVFNVQINGSNVLTNLDLLASFGKQTAATRNFPIKVSDARIRVELNAVTGKTVLSGIAIRIASRS